MVQDAKEPDIQEFFSLRGLWTRPLDFFEEKLIAREERWNRPLRTHGAVWASDRDLTPVLLKEMEEAYEHQSNIIAGLFGKPGRGKTQVAISLAEVMQQKVRTTIGELGTIRFTFGAAQTARIAPEIQRGDIIFQDEDPSLSGTDSQGLAAAIYNLQEVTLRYHQASLLVSSPTRKRWENLCHFFLEPFGWDIKNRRTVCKLYSGATLKPLGWVAIPLLKEDHQYVVEHRKTEGAFKARLQLQRGFSSVGLDPEQLKARAQLLTKYAFGREKLKFEELTDKEKTRIRKFRVERLKTILRKHAEEFPGTEDQQKRVVDEVWDQFLALKDQIKIEEEQRKKQERDAKAQQKRKEREERERKKRDEREQRRQQREKEREERERIKREERQKKAEERQRAEQAKQKAQQRKEEFLSKEREEAIPPLVDECIHYFDLVNNRPNNTVIKHFFTKNGIHKENLPWALGEVLDRVLRMAGESIDTASLSKVPLEFQVDENNRFLFDENTFLDALALQGNSGCNMAWAGLVEIYRKKKTMTVADLSDQHAISGSSVTNYVNRVKGAIYKRMGEAYEVFRAERLREERPDCEIQLGGGNESQPDLVIQDPRGLEFWSLKCYRIHPSKNAHTLTLKKDIAPELKAAKKQQGKLILDYYNPHNHTHGLAEIEVAKVGPGSKATLRYTGEIIVKY